MSDEAPDVQEPCKSTSARPAGDPGHIPLMLEGKVDLAGSTFDKHMSKCSALLVHVRAEGLTNMSQGCTCNLKTSLNARIKSTNLVCLDEQDHLLNLSMTCLVQPG